MASYRNTRCGNFDERWFPKGTSNMLMQVRESNNPFLDLSRKLYAVELKEYGNTWESSNFSSRLARKEAFQCRCVEFMKNAFSTRNDAGLFVSMTDKGCCEFCCFLTEEELKTLQGKDEVKSINLVHLGYELPEPVVVDPEVPDEDEPMLTEDQLNMDRFCALLKEQQEAEAAASASSSRQYYA